DGAAIGLAFQVSSSVGIVVAIAVIAHRFADGFNTTNVMLHHRNKSRQARQMLMIAAVMPILGALSTQLVTFSEKTLAIYLGFFAGFLLYIGASDILPQAHSKGPSRSVIAFTILGAAFIFGLTRLA
ncbi:MAG: ZIP family metal transporter, partial [Candidatus Saccharimonadales bacterium]